MPRKSTTTSSSKQKRQINLRFWDEHLDILRELAPNRKGYSALMAELLVAERARREGRIEGRLEERQRLLDLYDKNGTQN